MLVLTRKVGEKIIIDKNIHVIVVANTKGIVKLGIEAPENITVHREEVYNRINSLSKNEQTSK